MDQLNEVYGLNKGIVPGFIDWGKNAIRGNFGESWHYGIPVTAKFNEVIGISLVVNIITFVVRSSLGSPGFGSQEYSVTDYAITIFCLMVSLPTFSLATIPASSQSNWAGSRFMGSPVAST